MDLSLRERAHSLQLGTDWLFGIGDTVETPKVDVRRLETLETLLENFLKLVCSKCPSAFRDLERPLTLVSPLPAAVSPTNSTPRKWFTASLRLLPLRSASSRKADGDRSSSPTTQEFWRWR